MNYSFFLPVRHSPCPTNSRRRLIGVGGFLFLFMPLVAMDVDQNKKQINVQEEVQQLHDLWEQVKDRLHKAVQDQQLEKIVFIFKECFKRNSLLLEHKHQASKIVIPFVAEQLEKEFLLGLCTGHEAQKIMKLVGLYENSYFLNYWQGVNVGVNWLRTGNEEDLLKLNKKEELNKIKAKIYTDWKREIDKYIRSALEKGDIHAAQKVWKANNTYHSPILKNYVRELSDYIPDQQMHVTQSLPQNTPILSTPKSVQETVSAIERESVESSCESQTESEVLQNDDQTPRIIQPEPDPEPFINAQAAQVQTIKKPQTGMLHWIQQHPVISFTGIAAVCGGFLYKYFKKEKPQQAENKKINKPETV